MALEQEAKEFLSDIVNKAKNVSQVLEKNKNITDDKIFAYITMVLVYLRTQEPERYKVVIQLSEIISPKPKN